MTAATEILLPKLWAKKTAAADQRRFIHPPGGERISIAATGTKTGKTVGCAEWIVEGASSKPKSLWWWIAPSHYQASIGYDRAKSLLPKWAYKSNESLKTITLLFNGATIEFKTGEKPNLLFGAAVHGCVVDEASRMKEQAWIAINTTMTQTMGPIRVASNTDQGKSNWFYSLYQKGLALDRHGEKKFPGIVSWSIKTYENPHIKAEAFRELTATLPPLAYQALIEAIFPEDALTVFRNLNKVLVDNPEGWDPDDPTPILQRVRWDRSYVVGVDLAKYTDFTVITVIDIETREIVYYARLNLKLWESQMQRIEQVSTYYNGAQVVVDSTGVGDPIYERLTLLGVPIVPYKFNNPSKQRLIDNLSMGIENQDVFIPRGLTQLITELQMFEFRISAHGFVTFSAPDRDGVYDDSVISLALAYFAASQPFAVGYASVEKRGELEKELMKRDRSSKDWKRGRGF